MSVDARDVVTTWNAGAERLFGRAGADVVGQPFDGVLAGDDPTAWNTYRRCLEAGEAASFEMRQTRADGEPLDMSVTIAPMHGHGGAVIGASLIIRDIAGQRRREDHIRFLLRELTHRSKNLLAVIQAMARQSVSKEITPEEFVRRFSNRLKGLAGSHDLLSSVDWHGASLIGLVRSQLSHYEDLFETRILIAGADVTVRPEAA